MNATTSQIEALLAAYAEAWAANDSAQIAAHWDPTAPTHFYKAEEIDHYFHSLDDIKAYWAHNERFHDAIRLGFSALNVQPLAADLTLVIMRMRWDIRFSATAKNPDGSAFASAGKAMGGDNHVLAVVRETTAGPRFTGWNETPDAPVLYMWRLYEQSAAADI